MCRWRINDTLNTLSVSYKENTMGKLSIRTGINQTIYHNLHARLVQCYFLVIRNRKTNRDHLGSFMLSTPLALQTVLHSRHITWGCCIGCITALSVYTNAATTLCTSIKKAIFSGNDLMRKHPTIKWTYSSLRCWLWVLWITLNRVCLKTTHIYGILVVVGDFGWNEIYNGDQQLCAIAKLFCL